MKMNLTTWVARHKIDEGVKRVASIFWELIVTFADVSFTCTARNASPAATE
jgi:hypothetical protein